MYRNCSAIETHAMKFPVYSVCPDVNTREGLLLYIRLYMLCYIYIKYIKAEAKDTVYVPM